MKSLVSLRGVARLACLFASTLLTGLPAKAASDVLKVVVSGTTATEGAAIAGFAYNPTDQTMYVTGFGATGKMLKISNVDSTPTSQLYVTLTELQLYYRDGDGTRGVLPGGFQSGMLLNPQAIGSGPNAIAPYSIAIVADNSTTRFPNGSTATDPSVTKRFYQYNLQSAENQSVYTTLVTLSDMQAAIGAASTVTSNQGRQFAWSGDGQSIYFADSGTVTGGIWEVDAANGDIKRLYAADLSVEPAVRTSDGVDTIYFRGTGGNTGGIDSITYDGVTVGAPTALVTVSQLREFLDAGADQTPVVASMATDDQGNIYFNNTDGTPERRGVYKLDTEGRIVKVVGQAERNAFVTEVLNKTTAANSNTNRMQPRTINHPTAGNITQILYAENAYDGITGVNVFQTGDFDRNGVAGEAADLNMFSAALTTRGTALTNPDHYKFDLNGNSAVDWKDVKILQQFVDVIDGDLNFDGTLALAELDVLAANYFTESPAADKYWTTGDIASSDPLYAVTVADANRVNMFDVQLFADTWVDVLEQPITAAELTSRGYGYNALTAVLFAFGFSNELPGDFNGDFSVDGADFLEWQRQLSTTVTPGDGADANGDGLVNADDLAIWKGNFGFAGSAPETIAAVPEPSSLLLGVLAVAGVASRRRQKLAS